MCDTLTRKQKRGDTGWAMSRETGQVVRKPLRVGKRSRRAFDERFSLRFPGLAAVQARLISRLSPKSRLRQAALWRALRLSVEAYNRRDLEANLIGVHPEFEYHAARNLVEAGLVEPCYRGREGYRDFVATWDEVWGRSDHVEPVELIDLGDRVVMLAETPMRAQASGVPLSEAYAMVFTLKGGKAVRIEEYWDHAEALEAVGLRE